MVTRQIFNFSELNMMRMPNLADPSVIVDGNSGLDIPLVQYYQFFFLTGGLFSGGSRYHSRLLPAPIQYYFETEPSTYIFLVN